MGNISILLADDSITIQKVVGIIFATDGYTLTVVDNGKAAVQKAREIQPDVLLIDALMPGMTGYEVCAEIRNDPSLSAKPLLLLTGSFEPFDEAKAKESGADDHIVKPFESQQLIAKVNELYELSQKRSSATPVVAPVVEPVPAFDTPVIEEAFQPLPLDAAAVEPMPAIPVPAEEPSSQPAVSVDDPWGAYTTPSEPELQEPFAPSIPDSFRPVEPQFEPDVMEMVSQEPANFNVPETTDSAIGASWVPDGEQTFEFREDVAEAPASVVEAVTAAEIPEPELAFDADQFEPIPAVEPVSEIVADVPHSLVSDNQVPVPDASAPTVALTDEQLKAALMSASKETIERIVWEVVPDLAETLIKEAIRRITEGK